MHLPKLTSLTAQGSCRDDHAACVGIAVAVGLGTCGYLWIKAARDPQGILHVSQLILGVMLMAGALSVALSGLVFSAFLAYYSKFLYTFAGKGCWLILWGALSIQDQTPLSLGIGITTLVIAATYIVLQFASSLGAPEPLLYFGPKDALGRPILEAPGTAVSVPVMVPSAAVTSTTATTTKQPWYARGRGPSMEASASDSWLPSGQLAPADEVLPSSSSAAGFGTVGGYSGRSANPWSSSATAPVATAGYR